MSSSYFQTVLTGKNTVHPIDNAVIQQFEQNFSFSTHLHSTVEIFFCLEGDLYVQIVEQEVLVQKGEFLVIFPEVPHSVATKNESAKILQTHFYIELFSHMFSDVIIENNLYFLSSLSMNQKRFIHEECTPQIASCMGFIKQELEKRETNYQRIIDLYFAQLILLISRHIGTDTSSKQLNQSRHIVIALEFLETNYMEKIRVSDIADYCGISTRRLLTLFQQHLDISPSAYLIHLRINKSIEFMRSHEGDYSMTQLALDVGFGSLQHYSKTFKQVMGVSPTVFYSTRVLQ